MLLALLLAGTGTALAETARDITAECVMTPASRKKEFKSALDRSYRTFWNSMAGQKAPPTA